MNSKVLIIYYSWSGNTGNIAGLIQKNTSGQLFEIEPVKEYPSDYRPCVDQAKREINSGVVPELMKIPDNIDMYDVVFVGSPIWWHTMAPPVLSFLKQTDLSGKQIIPFCTHGGGGQGHFSQDVKKECREAETLPELVIFGNGGRSAESEVTSWLKNLKLLSGK